MEEAHRLQLARLDALLTRLAPPGERAELGERLLALADLTLTTNERINLTADDTPELFWGRHIEDALWAARMLLHAIEPPGPERPIMDVGTGGGMPGLVWGLLWPAAPLCLLEARQRRAAWLAEAGGTLGLARLTVLAERAETIGQQRAHRGQYALVTARAVARLSVLLELTLPLARVGGQVAAIKAADCLQEIHEAADALQELGSDPKAVRQLNYTRADGKQCVVVLIPKLRPTPGSYPRRPGVPKSHPL